MERKTNYHFNRFIISFIAGGIASIIFGEKIATFSNSLVSGFGTIPLIERYLQKKEWEEIYQNAPAQTAGLYAGLSLVKLLTQ